ncbi:DNA polymerase lambda [Verticillium alfalfae VaMs.102]|uniref:DNA polymerase lambda n=1 Tax=Verticillium alfalfae (strain VaMs.102 / ATCC MYA-4576 / FGSC 10136) TaxID=526221 RepID=C9SJH6_VERA1|nr:DNA polymerase lambda [Verticillium alfalfae VaMs.102]EEY18338.1 DNA polymerase lambda [Verticillium alfalfae VaMs.102]
MSSREPSLADKEVFFAELWALGADLNSEEDAIDEVEAERGRRSRLALQGRPSRITKPNKRSMPPAFSVSKSPVSASHPRRTASSPLPAKEPPTAKTIERTPLAAMRRPGKEAAEDSPSVVEETPIPDSTRAPCQPIHLLRTTSTPNPPMRQLHPPPHRDESPSLNATVKKRKRDAPVKLVPAQQQIFREQHFFFIPNDDIAPARRIRIRKAQEYGASWTRSLDRASHVIVDKGLSWKNIEPIVTSAGGAGTAVVVNETYPLDCIQFRSVLNPKQKQYLVTGYPSEQLVEAPGVAAPSDVSVPAGSPASLQLKPPPNNPKRFGYVPPPSTCSQSEQSAEEAQNELAVPGAPETSAAHEAEMEDELAELISQMQEFRDVPSDSDDDNGDGDAPIAGSSEPLSDAEHSDGEPSGKKQRPVRATRPHGRLLWPHQRHVATHCLPQGHPRSSSGRRAKYRRLPTPSVCPVSVRARRQDEEIVTTDRLRRLEHAERDPADETLQRFVRIYGVGNAQASRWIAQGHRTLDDLRARAVLSANQRIGIDHYDDLNTRIPRREVEALAAVVRSAAAALDPSVELIVGGSYRRGAASSGDIDLIVTREGTTSARELLPFLTRLTRTLEARGFLVAALATSRDDDAGGGTKWHGCCVLPEPEAARLHLGEGVGSERGSDPGAPSPATPYRPVWRRIDFLVVPAAELGAALLYFTGNDIFNRSMRLLAARKGMRLNQRGLYRDVLRGPDRAKVTDGALLEGRDERRIFALLNVTWREPHERWC